jgi:hypothetical protein
MYTQPGKNILFALLISGSIPSIASITQPPKSEALKLAQMLVNMRTTNAPMKLRLEIVKRIDVVLTKAIAENDWQSVQAIMVDGQFSLADVCQAHNIDPEKDHEKYLSLQNYFKTLSLAVQNAPQSANQQDIKLDIKHSKPNAIDLKVVGTDNKTDTERQAYTKALCDALQNSRNDPAKKDLLPGLFNNALKTLQSAMVAQDWVSVDMIISKGKFCAQEAFIADKVHGTLKQYKIRFNEILGILKIVKQTKVPLSAIPKLKPDVQISSEKDMVDLVCGMVENTLEPLAGQPVYQSLLNAGRCLAQDIVRKDFVRKKQNANTQTCSPLNESQSAPLPKKDIAHKETLYSSAQELKKKREEQQALRLAQKKEKAAQQALALELEQKAEAEKKAQEEALRIQQEAAKRAQAEQKKAAKRAARLERRAQLLGQERAIDIKSAHEKSKNTPTDQENEKILIRLSKDIHRYAKRGAYGLLAPKIKEYQQISPQPFNAQSFTGSDNLSTLQACINSLTELRKKPQIDPTALEDHLACVKLLNSTAYEKLQKEITVPKKESKPASYKDYLASLDPKKKQQEELLKAAFKNKAANK